MTRTADDIAAELEAMGRRYLELAAMLRTPAPVRLRRPAPSRAPVLRRPAAATLRSGRALRLNVTTPGPPAVRDDADVAYTTQAPAC